MTLNLINSIPQGRIQDVRGGGSNVEKGVRLPNFTQNLLKFLVKMKKKKKMGPKGGSSEPLEPPLNPPLYRHWLH